jgi:hypothetical protein
MILLLKLCLVPLLVASVTLGARRWGPSIGGWLTALPVVAGPTLCFYAIEQGSEFAARATQATLLGLIGVVAHAVTYARLCRRWSWPGALIASWLAFAVLTAMLYFVQVNLLVNLVLILVSLAVAKRLLPAPKPVVPAAEHPGRDLLLRMLAAAALVLILTSMADRLGPTLSGFLTPFPIATAIIAAFTHAERGPDAVISYFHGFVPALNSFALFCFVLALSLVRLGLPLAVTLALSVQLTIQGLNLWRMLRTRA